MTNLDAFADQLRRGKDPERAAEAVRYLTEFWHWMALSAECRGDHDVARMYRAQIPGGRQQ